VDKIIMWKRISYVIEADIKGYFDNVSHEWMMKFLEVRITDSSFLLLIRRFLKAGYFEAGQVILAEQGTPQGGNLSPMLANIFLHYVLDLWFEKIVVPRVKGACHMVRYADDFICMIQHADEAQRIIVALRKRFAKFGLELHTGKTRVISFGRFERARANKENRRANTFDFLGFTHYCGQTRKGQFILLRKTSNRKFRMKCKEMNTWLRKIRNAVKTKEWWPILCAKLRGHYQYYGVSGNTRSLQQFYNLVERMTLQWLNRRCQCQSFNWEEFRQYREHYPLPKPRIVHNFYTRSSVE
jgi:group II intron reverse transcriptase/maturase